MQTLVAVLGGKRVSYPMTARFIVEQRPATGGRYSLMGEAKHINTALTKMHRVESRDTVTRLRWSVDRKSGVLLKS